MTYNTPIWDHSPAVRLTARRLATSGRFDTKVALAALAPLDRGESVYLDYHEGQAIKTTFNPDGTFCFASYNKNHGHNRAQLLLAAAAAGGGGAAAVGGGSAAGGAIAAVAVGGGVAGGGAAAVGGAIAAVAVGGGGSGSGKMGSGKMGSAKAVGGGL